MSAYAVHIVGLVLAGVGVLLLVFSVIGDRSGDSGFQLWSFNFKGPPGLLMAIAGLGVFLFPFSGWFPGSTIITPTTISTPTTTLITVPESTSTSAGTLPTTTTIFVPTTLPISAPSPPFYIEISSFNDYCETWEVQFEYDYDDPSVTGLYFYADVTDAFGEPLAFYEGDTFDSPEAFPVFGIFCLPEWWTDALHYVELWTFNVEGVLSEVPAWTEWRS